MSAQDWLPRISLLISLAVPLGIFIGRHWMKARLEKGVQHRFDLKIEEMRADLRESEERLKSALRDRESEIAILRNVVLAASSGRQALLDKRRFEAVECIWRAVNDMAQLKGLSSMMAIMNVKEVAKEVGDPRMQQLLSMIGAGTPNISDLPNIARNERPFLPELTWAYFTAYSTILYGNLAVYKTLAAGVKDFEKYLKRDGSKEILKEALPHQSKWIDDSSPEAYHYLLDELENNLLLELRKILNGVETDAAEITKARKILNAVNQAVEEKEKAVAEMKMNV
ncbi:hypothetical protein [Bradyrhizobium canariense]|uniref:Uncharacterized protein n=1 Tax=Bradyrhizobium canariense TaxID=255045 RepID=A0A1H1MJR2_9BRAD|nr:hypothetical protein [Bradyrhizobium canariense]SDR87094.1 hypothetical protein SAMN05444158_0254 [Bradyrhizobium canariense]